MRIASCFLLLLALVMTATAADVTGKWSGTLSVLGADGKPTDPNAAFVILKQSGATLTGSGGPDESEQWPMTDAKISGNKITGAVASPDGVVYTLAVTVDGDRITGEVTVTQGGQNQKAQIDLKRIP